MDGLPPEYLRRIVRRIVSSLSMDPKAPLHHVVRRLAAQIQGEAAHPLGPHDLVDRIVVRLLDSHAASVRSTRRDTTALLETQRAEI